MDYKDSTYIFVFNCGSHEGQKGHGNGRKKCEMGGKIHFKAFALSEEMLHSLSIRLFFANEHKISWRNAKLFAKKC